jgi:hypothetical protein
MTILFKSLRFLLNQRWLNPKPMSRKTGIIVNGRDVKIGPARIIGLYAAGVPTDKVLEILCIEQSTLHNYNCYLYDVLELEKGTHAIGVEGVLSGFDQRCYYKGRDVLDCYQRERLYQQMPKLQADKRQIEVIITYQK